MTKVQTRFASQSAASKAFYVFVRAFVVGATRSWTRLRLVGAERVPKTGAFILAPVHRSNVDTPISSVVTRRRMRYMGKDSLWTNRAAGWVFSSLGAFPVSRGTVDLEAMKRCLEVLGAGEPLVVFPEGERKSGPIVQPLFDGAAYLSLKSGAPIVPVGIGGSAKVMPKGSKWIYPRKVVVLIGEPIAPRRSESGRVQRSQINELTALLHERLQELFDAAQVAAGT